MQVVERKVVVDVDVDVDDGRWGWFKYLQLTPYCGRVPFGMPNTTPYNLRKLRFNSNHHVLRPLSEWYEVVRVSASYRLFQP
jgi:hypothetical protein